MNALVMLSKIIGSITKVNRKYVILKLLSNNCLDCVHCYIESDGGFIEVERTWNACKKGKNNVGKFPFTNTKCKLFENLNKKEVLK